MRGATTHGLEVYPGFCSTASSHPRTAVAHQLVRMHGWSLAEAVRAARRPERVAARSRALVVTLDRYARSLTGVGT